MDARRLLPTDAASCTRRRLLIAGAAAAAFGGWDARAGRPTHGDRELYVRVLGSGPPVVFLHGLMGSHEYWGSSFDELASTHALSFVDLAGFGRSRGVTGPYDLDAQALRVIALWAGAPSVTLVGHSLGALLALRIAAMTPVVRTVVAFNLPAYRSSAEARRLIGSAGLMEGWLANGDPGAELACRTAHVARPIVRLFAPGIAPKTPPGVARAAVDHNWLSMKQSMAAIIDDARPRAWIEACAATVRVVLATNDSVAPQAVVSEVLAGSSATLVVIPGAHHLPLEDPAACMMEVRRAGV